MRVRPGTALQLWSEDAFNGVLRSVDDLSSAKVDLRFVNPQTGPFYVEGAEPGDTLVLHLVAVEPARDWGASAAIPFFGGLPAPLPLCQWVPAAQMRDGLTVLPLDEVLEQMSQPTAAGDAGNVGDPAAGADRDDEPLVVEGERLKRPPR